MNNRAKGKRSVNKTLQYLGKQGYITAQVEKTGRFIKDKDMFGFADIVAISSIDTLFVQVKSNKADINYLKNAINDLPRPPHVKWLVFIWVDYVRHPKIVDLS